MGLLQQVVPVGLPLYGGMGLLLDKALILKGALPLLPIRLFFRKVGFVPTQPRSGLGNSLVGIFEL